MDSGRSDDDTDPSMLALIIDTNPMAWKLRRQFGSEKLLDYNDIVSQLIIFCHSYALMNRSNRIVVIANHPTESVVIYPKKLGRQPDGNRSSETKSDEFILSCNTLHSVLAKVLLECVADQTENLSLKTAAENPGVQPTDKHQQRKAFESTSSLAQSLSIALCVTNRQLQLRPKLQPRIMIVQLSKDVSATYNSVMNSIFSAQKLGVVVDAVVLSKDDSRFLQQACLLTRGVYQRPVDQHDLLQLMLCHNLPSIRSRSILNAPMQKLVDFRASCFCHCRPVEFAFMCSVCLALTCDLPEHSCSTCGTAVRRIGMKGSNA